MRIGMITGEYPPMQGGIGAYTRILAGEIAAQGHEVFVLSRTRTMNSNPRVQLSASVTGWGMGSLLTARRWASESLLDVISIQYQTAAYGMSPFIHFLPDALRPVPVVTTFHDLRYPYLFPKAGSLRDWIVRRLARASAGVIATNHEDAARLRDLKLALIPIGSNISANDVKPADRRLIGSDDDFLIANFGLINRSKGIDTLIESLALLRAAGIPARLVLIGGVAGSSDPTNAAYIEEIDRLIEQNNLAAFVHKTGYLDDAGVSSWLRAADAIALPFADGASFRRGSLMAAIQHGCAIVTTQPAVTIPEFNAANMVFVPPNNPAALTDALRRLYQSPDTRARLQQGAANLAQQFDWTEIARATVDFYQRCSGARA